MTRAISGEKIVVTDSEVGSQFPSNRMETYKEIVIDGRKSPFQLEGGVFSPNLQVLGGGVVKGPAFANETVRMENDGSEGVQVCLSGITAQKSIVSISSGEPGIEHSFAAKIDGLRFVIRGDVISGERISLQDTCVIGSVKAPQITLKHSMVLGTTVADYHIECLASSIGMYQSSTIAFLGPCSIFWAGGQSVDQPQFKKYDEQKRFPTTLRFVPLCRVKNVGCQMGMASLSEGIEKERAEKMKTLGVGISCGSWCSHQCPFANQVGLGLQDFYNISRSAFPSVLSRKKGTTGGGQKNPMPPDPKSPSTPVAGASDSLWILGILGRAFAIEKLDEQNQNFLRILHGVFAFEHLSPEQRAEERRNWKQRLSPHELHLMKTATIGLENSP